MRLFLLECEKARIAPKQILKNLKDKTLSFTNVTLRAAVLKAMKPFIKHASKNGLALDSLILAKNNFVEDQLAQFLSYFLIPGAKIKNVTIADNTIGEKSLQ